MEEAEPNKPIIQYHETEHAIKMLPLVICYCRDIEDSYREFAVLHAINEKLSNMIGVGRGQKQKVEDKRSENQEQMNLVLERFRRWRDELSKLYIKICSPKLGRVNIPIYDDETKSVISLCIHKLSEDKSLEWHCVQDNHEQAHPYWYKYVPSKTLLVPQR